MLVFGVRTQRAFPIHKLGIAIKNHVRRKISPVQIDPPLPPKDMLVGVHIGRRTLVPTKELPRIPPPIV